jgi:hypothetical protein
LYKIHSNHLLPINRDQVSRISYFLIKSNTTINDHSFNLDRMDSYTQMKWMSQTQMKEAQRKHMLMGLEPLNIYKQLSESKMKL